MFGILINTCILLLPFRMAQILILCRLTKVASIVVSSRNGSVIPADIKLKKTVYRDVSSVNKLEGIVSSSVL